MFQKDLLKDSFESFGDHKGLRTIAIETYPEELHPDYSWLKHLLTRNRRIELRGEWIDLVTDRR